MGSFGFTRPIDANVRSGASARDDLGTAVAVQIGDREILDGDAVVDRGLRPRASRELIKRDSPRLPAPANHQFVILVAVEITPAQSVRFRQLLLDHRPLPYRTLFLVHYDALPVPRLHRREMALAVGAPELNLAGLPFPNQPLR